MVRQFALRVRLYPTPEQTRAFAQIAGSYRLVFNLALEQRCTFWRQAKATGQGLSCYAQKMELPALKREAPFLQAAPSHCLQQTLHDLDAVYKNFFEDRTGYPKPRKRYEHDSFRFPDRRQIRLDSRRELLYLPKCGYRKGDYGPTRCRLHRRIKGSLRSVNRAILDKGWGMLRVRPGQKLAARGGRLLAVPANHTSQRCYAYSHVVAASRLSQERFECVACGHEANADYNAALTIRRLGLVRLGLAGLDGPVAGTAVAARGSLGISRAAKRECSSGSGGVLPEPASSGCLAA